MSTTTDTVDVAHLSLVAFERFLGLVGHDACRMIVTRDVPTCEHTVAKFQALWDAAQDREPSCCRPVVEHADHYPLACEHLRALWAARTYLELAQRNAPVGRAFGCDCRGTGEFCSGGAVVNGVYTGKRGTCFRCNGKGWQSDEDRKRNAYYDNHVRRINL